MFEHHVYARLARVEEFLPWRGRAFGHGVDRPGFELVDDRDPFVLSLIADGSIVFDAPPPVAEPPSAEPPAGDGAHVDP